MKAYVVTYELTDPHTKQFIATIEGASLLVEDRPDVIKELQRMYPMYEVSLTTLNWDTDVNSLLSTLDKETIQLPS